MVLFLSPPKSFVLASGGQGSRRSDSRLFFLSGSDLLSGAGPISLSLRALPLALRQTTSTADWWNARLLEIERSVMPMFGLWRLGRTRHLSVWKVERLPPVCMLGCSFNLPKSSFSANLSA